MQMCSKNNFMYYDFINYFISSVIGKMDYKKKCCSMYCQICNCQR